MMSHALIGLMQTIALNCCTIKIELELYFEDHWFNAECHVFKQCLYSFPLIAQILTMLAIYKTPLACSFGQINHLLTSIE